MKWKRNTQKREPDRLQFVSDLDPEVAGCVYKLYCDDHYVIVKGKTLDGSVFFLEKGYAHFVAFDHRTDFSGNKNVYYQKLYEYIQKHPNVKFKVELLLESDNAYQLLKREQLELNKAISDRKCLNNNLIAYIPQRRLHEKNYGWISQFHVMAFKKFYKNHC